MITLSYPFIFLCLLTGCIVAVYKRHFAVGIFAAVACLYINSYARIIALNLPNPSSCRDNIKVLTFNVNGSMAVSDEEIKRIYAFIQKQDADILFLAEDFENVSGLLDSLLIQRYPYSTYRQKTAWSGHYFYSKYPLGKVEHIDIESNRFSYCFHCNMAFGLDSVSLYGCHMASNNYKSQRPSLRPENIDGILSLMQYINNINLASKQRCEEVIKITSHPEFNDRSIVMGDLNDVSGSEPLNLLDNAGLKDAWWEGGCGYGATIYYPLPFRIDHIMYREGLKLKNIKKIDSQGLSDHDALMATFE